MTKLFLIINFSLILASAYVILNSLYKKYLYIILYIDVAIQEREILNNDWPIEAKKAHFEVIEYLYARIIYKMFIESIKIIGFTGIILVAFSF